MKRKPNADHVVMDSERWVLECRHCWQTMPFPRPIALGDIGAAGKPFLEAHRYCVKPAPKRVIDLLLEID